MASKKDDCCGTTDSILGCCRVEALVTVDERGQMVLPKEVREKFKLKSGEKLAVTVCESGGKVCCLCLVKADELAGKVQELLGPVMKEIIKG
ncbi:MAG: AbrB/MazE/SpoVT family DNA-binding domain-containing protein [candidate division Zixibacteria bacterium]|nr:AbrB/MazE/SpoVT family DNA-binding domain-containing protein [candidate division Zixibacteria bacterium]